MSANRSIDTQHPHFVHIPDAHTEGVRAYREPDVPHPLQVEFLDPARERAWIETTARLLSGARAGDAQKRVMDALAGFDGVLARLCKSTAETQVELQGWEDLLPVLAEWEGPPITAITLGLSNPPDRAFELGQDHEPELLLALYSDECFPFSCVAVPDLLAECAKESPAWLGAEEDVEFHCRVGGLTELNTALIHCKHRKFLRDGRDGVSGRAPGGYVEFLLASWLLAARFLRAADEAVSDHGLPPACRLIAGTFDMNADVVAVLGAEHSGAPAPSSRVQQPTFAPLTMKPWTPREDPTADVSQRGPTLRQRLESETMPALEHGRPGFLARLFGRLRGS